MYFTTRRPLSQETNLVVFVIQIPYGSAVKSSDGGCEKELQPNVNPQKRETHQNGQRQRVAHVLKNTKW